MLDNRKKILFILGTRPEAIKMAPVIKEFQNKGKLFNTKICITAQHREMLDQVLKVFDIVPDYDLDLMTPNQNLYTLSAAILKNMQAVLSEVSPEYVFVHGDTTTSMLSALAAFYSKTKICHIEAGLRTFNKYSPFPEEMNRSLTARLADFHFAPTALAKENLIKESVRPETIHITGNTVIDALFYTSNKIEKKPSIEAQEIIKKFSKLKNIILVTGHRRENFGDGFINICHAIQTMADQIDVNFIYPVHHNPNVRKPVFEMLSGYKNIHLIEPLSYESFVTLMKMSSIILTDSGGIQEEAPSLGKPVLVMRNSTERPEAVEAGTVILVGTEKDKIINEISLLINDEAKYNAMSSSHNPYGDGKASERILKVIIDDMK